MAEVHTVIILKWVEGEQVEQDVSEWFEPRDMRLEKMTWAHKGTSTMLGKIPERYFGIGSSPVLVIDVLQEVWIGWRDGVYWTKVRFGGYIGPYKLRRNGGMVYIDIELYSYNIDLSRMTHRGWPQDVTESIPLDSPDDYLKGYPPNIPGDDIFTLRHWLVGLTSESFDTPPVNGIIAEYLPGVDLDGIDTMIGALRFGIIQRPTLGDLPGFLMPSTIEQAVKEVIRVAVWTASVLEAPVEPVYWMQAIIDPIDGSRVKPQFRLKDIGNYAAVDMHFVDSEPSGDQFNYWGFEKRIDPSNLVDVVEVYGLGAEIVNNTGEDPEPEYRLIYSRADSTVGNYPAPYHKPVPGQTLGGWHGEPVVSEKLEQAGQAQDLAAMIQASTYHPRESVSFFTEAPVEEWMLIQVDHGFTNTSAVYPVFEVTADASSTRIVYQVQAGYRKPTVDDIQNGDSIEFILLRGQLGYLRQLRLWGGDTMPILDNGTGTNRAMNVGGRPISGSPSSNGANVFQPSSDAIAASNHYPATNRHLFSTTGLPLNPIVKEDGGALPTAAVARPNEIYWTRDANGVVRPVDWKDENNYDHPIHYPVAAIDEQWQDIILPTVADLTTVRVKFERDENGEVIDPPTLTTITIRRGVLSGTWSYTDIDSTTITETDPLHVDYHNFLMIKVEGIPSGHVQQIELSEKEPLVPTKFGGTTVAPPP